MPPPSEPRLCCYCAEPLTPERSTVEHIVQSAVGGRLKSRRVWCAACCETALPRDLDEHLAEGLYPLATLLGLRRDRGRKLRSIQARLPDGAVVNIRPDGTFERARPVVEDVELDAARGVRRLRVNASTPEAARRHFEAIRRRRYPDAEIVSALEQGTPTTELFEQLTFEFPVWDMCKIGRALAKIALHFHIHHWGSPADLPALVRLLHADAPDDLLYGPAQGSHPVPSSIVGPVLHRIDLVADATSRQVHARVEVLSVFHAHVVLDRSYTGPSRRESYGFDVITGRRVQLPPPARLAPEIADRGARVVAWAAGAAANAVGQLGLRHARCRDAVQGAIKTALAGVPPGSAIGPEELESAQSAIRAVL